MKTSKLISNENAGSRFYDLRRTFRKSQTEWATLLGYSNYQRVANMEKTFNKISFRALATMCTVGINYLYICGDDNKTLSGFTHQDVMNNINERLEMANA